LSTFVQLITVSVVPRTINALATELLRESTNDSYELSGGRDRQLMMVTERERNKKMDNPTRWEINTSLRSWYCGD